MKKIFIKIWVILWCFPHRVAHLFGWNSGRVVGWHDSGNLFLGFRCSHCQKIDPETISMIQKYKDPYEDINIIQEEE